MRYFALSFDKIVLRFFLMMALVIGGVFSGTYWLAAFALPVFLSAILGVSFRPATPKAAKLKTIKNQRSPKHAGQKAA